MSSQIFQITLNAYYYYIQVCRTRYRNLPDSIITTAAVRTEIGFSLRSIVNHDERQRAELIVHEHFSQAMLLEVWHFEEGGVVL